MTTAATSARPGVVANPTHLLDSFFFTQPSGPLGILQPTTAASTPDTPLAHLTEDLALLYAVDPGHYRQEL